MGKMSLCKNQKEGERRYLRIRLWTLAVIMAIFAFPMGCAASSDSNSLTLAEETLNETITPMAFPEDVSLTGFFITHQGMAAEPYYMMKETEDGVYLKISANGPGDWTLYADADEDSQEYSLNFVDTVNDYEDAQIAQPQGDSAVRALEDAIAQAGALGWNGYDAYIPMDDVLDADDFYILYLELSDGTTVAMYGHNTRPKGFAGLLAQTQEIYSEIFPDCAQ